MLSLQPEITELKARGVIDAATLQRALALDDGSVFSLHLELRIGLYASVAALLAGLGLFLNANLAHVGRLTIIVCVAACACLCYAYAERERQRTAAGTHAGEYVLLLGALIVSADVAYAESQFRWLGADWSRYLPVLTVLHAVTAYRYRSPLVLSAALTAFAAWLGIELRFDDVLEIGRTLPHAGGRAFVGAALLFTWAAVHRRTRAAPELLVVLEHFTVNMALLGALIWCFDASMRWPGVALLALLAATVARAGLVRRRESFVVYAILYAAVGVGASVVDSVNSSLTAIVACLAITAAAAMGLLAAHNSIARDRP